MIKLGRPGYLDTEFKVMFVDSADYVEEEESMDAEKALENARKGIIKESSLGKIAFALVEENSEPSFEDAEWIKYIENTDFDIPSSNASSEGKYQVYVANERNHTRSISAPSNLINVSKIAPRMSGISLIVKDNDDQDLMLIENNAMVPDASIELDAVNNYMRRFKVIVGDDFSSIGSEGDKPQVVLEAVEIDSRIYDAEHRIVFPQSNPDGLSDVIAVSDSNEFVIDKDPGTYIIRATVTYHGTQRVTITEPFFVTSRTNFN